jgi:hypothetical protein
MNPNLFILLIIPHASLLNHSPLWSYVGGELKKEETPWRNKKPAALFPSSHSQLMFCDTETEEEPA